MNYLDKNTMYHSSTALNIELPKKSYRFASIGDHASVLTDIYQEEVNLAIWKNELSHEIKKNVENIVQELVQLNVMLTSTPSQVVKHLVEFTPDLTKSNAFCEHIALLVDMFCTLFELKQVGLRLMIIDKAMCPKFHVDRVPCRLITTFSGVATEWIPHHKVDRSKLGASSSGIPDDKSGILQNPEDIQRLITGDIALLKGEGWYNNENCGAVHRSPAISKNEKRLLLSLDFMD